MADRRAWFITLEGLDGVGKSTQITALAEHIRKVHRRRVYVTREPGGTAVGEGVRELFLNPADNNMDAMTEVLLMFAARAEHIATVIRPALADGQDVLCDRFTDSTYAYQGAGHGIRFDVIATLETLVQQDLRPDRVLLLDCAVAKGRKRVAERQRDRNRISAESLPFYERVRAGYLHRARADSNRYRVIDAWMSKEQVQRQLRTALDGLW